MSATLNEHDQWEDEATGELVVNGFVYFGDQNLDPVLNPLAGGIFSDRELTVALSNPQRTGADGRTVNKVWLSGRYSIKLEDENNVQLYQELDVGENETIGNTSLTNVQGTNTITAEGVPTVDELVDGQFYVLKPVITNTGAMTLQIDSTTAKAVEVNGGALTGGEFAADITVAVAFNSGADVFDMVVQVNKDALGLGTTNDVAFNTVDIGATGAITGIATQAQQETGTSLLTVTSPGAQHFHQSAAKGWVHYDQNAQSVLASYNVTGVADTSTGVFEVQWDTDFSSANYAVVATAADQANADSYVSGPANPLATHWKGIIRDNAGNVVDGIDIQVIAFGDQ